jgi:transcriptional regulator with XRE-family HTH domain
MAKSQNIVGPQIRRLRNARDWSQEVFAARLGVAGLDVSRGTLSKIEAQIRCVTDAELVFFAKALGVNLEELFPGRGSGKR